MKSIIRHIKNIISSQRILFFLLTFLSIVPNVLLAITDHQTIPIRIASVLMPMAIIMLVLMMAKKPGIPMWIMFPLIILDAGQIVLLYLFGESVIAVDMFLNLTSSNASEASELLGNIFIVILCVFVLYTLPTLCLSTYSIKLKDTLGSKFRTRWSIYSLGIFCIGAAICLISSCFGNKCVVKDDVYPINALYNLQFAISKAERNANYALTSKDFKFESFRRDSADRREIYVLVVGETSRAMEWSLYGYERETTPNLQREKNLVCFTDAVTQSNNTHKSVPIILSAASAESYDVLWKQKSIVSAFKEAGFKTLVIANQKLNTSIIWSFYNEADKFIDMSEQVKGFTLQSPYDGEVIPFLKKEIESGSENLFIVLHTYGSHFNYHERYPNEFKKFLPDKALGIRAAYKQELRNAYDNSILYTDYVLSQIINELKTTNACSSMMYLSDHGEDIYDDSRSRYLHASPIPTCYQLHIPYIIWYSDSYKERFPEKYQTALANRTMPVSTNSVFHTMLDIASIDTPIKDCSLSLSSDDFQPTNDRKYLGDHDMPISLVKLGLKKQDFEMLDKWNMKYTKD